MSSRSLVICDKEEGYATALATYLTQQKEIAFQVQVCNDPAQLVEMQRLQKIDILLISEIYSRDKKKEITAGKILILTERCGRTSQQSKKVLYKYQSGDTLLAQIEYYIWGWNIMVEKEDISRKAFRQFQMLYIMQGRKARTWG